MACKGFYITTVRLTGESVEAAVVDFKDGFNVIHGPSDTGKSYVLQLVSWVFGASNKVKNRPKPIPEAKKYDTAHVVVRSRRDGSTIKLRRSLDGGPISLNLENGKTKTLKATHKSGDIETLSGFLLELCGLLNAEVFKNQSGGTRKLSFQDIVHLAIIREATIIKDISPIRGPVATDNTLRQSVFRMFLTGRDNSAASAKTETAHQKGKRRGRDELLTELKQELEGQAGSETRDELAQRHERLTTTMKDVRTSLESEQFDVRQLETRRQELFESLKSNEAAVTSLDQLLVRFDLLAEQYESDLARVTSTSSVARCLEEFPRADCGFCGAPSSAQKIEPGQRDEDVQQIAVAVEVEAAEIRRQLRELEATRKQTADELESARSEQSVLLEEWNDVTKRVREELRPRVNEALVLLQSTSEQLVAVTQKLGVYEQLDQLAAYEDDDSEIDTATTDTVITEVTASETTAFCSEVDRLLSAWQLDDKTPVTFSEDAQDLIVGGRDRRVEGKGFLAITHAAFTIALNNFCVDNDRDWCSFVILDSPLNPLRLPKGDPEGIPVDVKASFYRTLAGVRNDRQVIVLENEPPPEDLHGKATVIEFTKTAAGRYGFIPAAA